MDSRYPPDAPLRSGGAVRRGPVLRTAKLNMAGRAALVGSCLMFAALGFAAGRLLGVPVAATTSAGGLLPLVLVVVVDRRRWAGMLAAYGWGGTPDAVCAVALDLVRRGVVANVEMDEVGDSAFLWYRNADADVVSTVLAEHGVRQIGQEDR